MRPLKPCQPSFSAGPRAPGKEGGRAPSRTAETQLVSLLSQVLSLQDLCCRAVVSCTPVHLVDKLPLPMALRGHLKSFSMANGLNARMMHGRSYSVTASSVHKRNSLRKGKAARQPQSPPKRCTRNSCKVS